MIEKTIKGKKVCVKRNELGDCIKFEYVGDKVVPVFKEEEKECNKELYEEWKDITKKRRIAIIPEE